MAESQVETPGFSRADTPFGAIDVVDEYRTPRLTRSGWSAVEEYLLTEAAARLDDRSATVAVVNDRCGAITAALAFGGHSVVALSERASERVRIAQTLTRNSIEPVKVVVSGMNPLPDDVARCQLVLVVIGGVSAQLRRQLVDLGEALRSHDTTSAEGGASTSAQAENPVMVIGGAMTKDVHNSTVQAFDSAIGETSTSLAWRRARLVRSTLRRSPPPNVERWSQPVRYATTLIGGGGVDLPATILALPGTFGDRRVDEGTQLLLDTVFARIPADQNPGLGRVVDLGCGTGVLGLGALAAGADGVVFVDDADAAVESAQLTLDANEWVGDAARRNSRVAHELHGGLDSVGWDEVDTVLCNPPFHHGRVQGPDIADAMFRDAAGRLRPGGAMWVVGNRHMGYHRVLRKHFAEVEVRGSSPRFVVLRARQPKGTP
jgi:23S rRNA (guanine1835-N2)-methyltransferase